MKRLAALAFLLLLAACGQKGPLYLPDAGIVVPAQPAGPDDAPGPGPTSTTDGQTTTPVTPASPDRSDEPRRRIPDTPTPAEAQ